MEVYEEVGIELSTTIKELIDYFFYRYVNCFTETPSRVIAR
jgi:hypothetical protein